MPVATIITYIFIFIAIFFQMFFLLNYFELREQEKKRGKAPYIKERERSVTVIVPIWNEAATVGRTLESLLALDYPIDLFKIIVVDDGSQDDSAQIVRSFITERGLASRITLIQKPNGGKYTALNIALDQVTTEFVGCLDADSFVHPQALKRIMQKFSQSEIQAVTPTVKVYNPQGFLGNLQKAEYMFGSLLRRIFNHLGAIYVTPGPFSIFRTSMFQSIGQYRHAHQVEDCELALRMQKHHLKIENAHDAFIYTTTPKTLRGLYVQRLRWTSGFLFNAVDYRDLFFSRKYGHLGMLVLPAACFSIISTLYFFWTNAYNTIRSLSDKVAELYTVGWLHPRFSIDLFYFNTELILFVYLVALVAMVYMIVNSRIATEEKTVFGADSLLFIFLYMFITPVWMTKAMYNLVTRKSASWR